MFPKVCDLEEFECGLSGRGLAYWQRCAIGEQLAVLGTSQETRRQLLTGTAAMDAIIASLFSDQPTVITPARAPPSRASVCRWLVDKQRLPDDKVPEDSRPSNPIAEPRQQDPGDVPDVYSAVLATREEHFLVPEACSPHQQSSAVGPRKGRLSKTARAKGRRVSLDAVPIVMATSPTSPVSGESQSAEPASSTPMRAVEPVCHNLPCTPILAATATPPTSHRPRVLTATPTTSGTPDAATKQRHGTPAGRPRDLRLGSNTRRPLLQPHSRFVTPSTSRPDVSQIEGPTPKNSFGFKLSMQNVRDAKSVHEFQYLTTMSLELHVRTRGDLRPDPEFDAIDALFYSLAKDIPPECGQREVVGVLVVDPASAKQQREGGQGAAVAGTGASVQTLLHKTGVASIDVTYVDSERELLDEICRLVLRHDPDILVGYEIEMQSWGYMIQRAAQLSVNLCPKLSRLPDAGQPMQTDREKEDVSDPVTDLNVPGRIVLNLWKVLRHEVTLNVYSFESVAYHVLHRRLPLFSCRTLTQWFDHRDHLHRWRTIEYYIMRCRGNLQLIEQLDLIGQTSELARVFGIEFYHVLSRGTQYRVESMMLRIAKPMDYIPVSPGVQQRSRMKAPECIPLNMEPESRLYTHPVVVVDFQSLYPSIMIAHNYCFSTCLGRLESLAKCGDGPFDFGCTSLNVTPKELKSLAPDISLCPNGVAFVRSHIRKGILPRMVEEILNTRLMVKQSMKLHKGDKTLQRLLHARQLGLKLIANVTFGYTSANFSGRMPLVEVGDSIVRKARETLERAIELVEKTAKWGAKVVYGDTDSMFILLEGRSKEDAFRIGYEIADAVTADNPKPMKLKFEKVYMPCVLQTKKRYVGFMYETPDQAEPTFDAKGIETVRRDTCRAVSKILERSLKILFTSRDISQVKQYVQRQCHKLMEGRVSIQDCVFAKEFRGMNGYKPAACVPALEIAKRLATKDRRAEPRVSERVPYVIVYGTPGLPLIQLVRQPGELIQDPALRINATYYITKQILPPLDRVFALVGVDVKLWYNELPKVVRTVPPAHFFGENKKGTISQYFSTLTCPVCEETTNHGMCDPCRADPQRVVVVLGNRMAAWQRTYHQLSQICGSCMGCRDPDLPCVSLDCPILFRVQKALRDQTQVPHLLHMREKMVQL